VPRECTVCNHPDAVLINEHLVGIGGKLSNRAIARQYDLHHDAVQRHRQHVPELLVKASQAMEVAEADSLIDQMRDLQRRALSILDKAEDAEDLRACLVSNRVGLGGAESAPFTRGTASRGPSLRGGFFGFRSVSSKESLQTGPPRTPENAKKV
jgi:hypothetical protein